ncbi:SpoIIE family protein phosphatase [Nonomuraea sp. NPDC050680]|uniref:SpoIIE family protein phosphatase n=1 Tax=Nonomuraea sp. NPDC050680 TaxID=3154630 RepID=UPI0033F38A26
MSNYPPFGGRYDCGAAAAGIRELLTRLRRRMRNEAIVDEATARLAIRLNIRPAEAADELSRMAHDSGIPLVEVAMGVDRPPDKPVEPPKLPGWVTGVLESVHIPACFLTPVRDATGRVVDFLIAAANQQAGEPAGRTPEELRGHRLIETSPGAASSGLFDDLLNVLETGVTLHRGPLEFAEARDHMLWPATMTVRAVRMDNGLLVTWRALDDEEVLVAGWERAQRLAELGWGEWNLATERTLWTPQMYEMFGREHGEGPLPLEELPLVVVPEDLSIVDDQLRTLLEHSEAVETEFRIQHRHGLRHLSVVSEPVLDTDGLPVKVRFLVQDVTKNRRRERALAVAHAQASRQRERAEEEHRVTVQLQNTILPVRRGLMQLPGLSIGVRYLPGEELSRLGGDWFKARPIPDGRVLLAIGDAMGHGLAAASLMLQMRSALAGLAYTHAPANQLTTWLNDLLVHSNEGVTVTGTAIIGHFDPMDRTLTWTNAGHPPPILVRNGHAELLEGVPGTMLGAFEAAQYGLATTQLEADDTLVLYTDGVIERRSQDLDAGIAALAQAGSQCVGDEPEKMIDCVLSHLGGRATDDDVCIVAARVL